LKVKAMGRPRRAAGATPTPPQARAAVASYRLPASRGGSGLTALGSYAVRLNATAGQAASGQIVGMFTVNGPPAPAPLVVVSSWPVENGKAALTGVVRNTSSVVGNTTGWVIDRLDAAGAGQFIDVDVDTGAFAGRAALLNGRRIKLIGTVQQQYRPGRGSISVLVVESITSAT
jgi:hypothetical protein